MYKLLLSVAVILIPFTCFSAFPDGFIGTYQSMYTKDCETLFLIIGKDNISINECKKLSYKIIDSGTNYVVINTVPVPVCPQKTIKIERKNIPLKAESKEPLSIEKGSDVKPFAGCIVTTYESYFNSRKYKPLQTQNYREVEPYKADDQIIAFRNGKTTLQRKQALHEMNLQCYPDRNKYNIIGLKDSSAEVRSIAALFLRGKPNHFIPLLIDAMINDPNADVRYSAAFNLSECYTSDDSSGKQHIEPLENNLDKLLIGLKNPQIGIYVANILGLSTTSTSVSSCHMSNNNRKKILKVLNDQLKEINKLDAQDIEARPAREKESFDTKTEIESAIQKINNCKLTRR